MLVVNARFLTKKITGLERFATEVSPFIKKLFPGAVFISHKGIKDRALAEDLGVVEFGSLKEHLWEQVELPIYLMKHGNPLLLNLVNTGPLFYKNQVTVIHDLAFIRHPEWYTKKAAVIFKLLVKRIAKQSKRIITVSNFSKDEVIKLLDISPEKIKVVYGSVPGMIKNLSKDNYENNYGNYILAVSSLEPRKNLKTLTEAFNKLKPENLRLIIAGVKNGKVFSEPELGDLNNPDIVFTGYVSDKELVGLYKNALLFVYPSMYEGFGYPPLEALECGCPVISSNAGSLPEILGNAVEYFNPRIENSLNESLKNNLARINSLKSEVSLDKTNVSTWEKCAEEIIKVVKETTSI